MGKVSKHINMIAKVYGFGFKMVDIAGMFGTVSGNVSKLLVANNVPTRPKKTKSVINYKAIKDMSAEDKAQWVEIMETNNFNIFEFDKEVHDILFSKEKKQFLDILKESELLVKVEFPEYVNKRIVVVEETKATIENIISNEPTLIENEVSLNSDRTNKVMSELFNL